MTATTGDRSGDRTTDRVATAAAEAGLAALAAGTVVSLSRLLDGTSWLGDLFTVTFLAWVIALLLRRLRVPTLLATAAHLLLGGLTLSWLLAPDTLTMGVPTTATWHTLTTEVRAAFAEMSDLVAPVQAAPGFLFALGAVMWIVVGFADTAAMRYRAPVQAAVPFVAVFVAAGVLARDHGRLTAAIAFGIGLVVYLVTQRIRSRSTERWLPGLRRRGLTANATSATALVLVAVTITAVAWPSLPIGDEPVVDLRQLGRGSGPRTVVSPFVGIGSMLGERSEEVMFTVHADEPAYWRLTALDTFDTDRDIWVSRATYQDTSAVLPPNGTIGPGPEFHQEFRLRGLSSLWLPAAYAPREIDAEAELNFDPGSSSVILRDGTEPDSMRYRVVSEAPQVPGQLPQRGASPPAAEIEMPQLPLAALQEIERFRDIGNPAERMRALQDWFRGFTYDESVDYRGHADPITAFLDSRRGFCQQFSSAFALFARELGVPSRVAVGFTPGETVGEIDPSTPREFVVRGRNAHAWPEVYFADVGWVPFEPTPQRGNPQAEEYTGVPAEQAEAPSEAEPSPGEDEAPPTTRSEPVPPEDASRPEDLAAVAQPESDGEPPAPQGGRLPAAALVVIGAVLALGTWWVVVLARRSRRGSDPSDLSSGIVARAWSDTVAALQAKGVEVGAGDTPRDVAALARRHLQVTATQVSGAQGPGGPEAGTHEPGTQHTVPQNDAADAVVELAELEGRRLWAAAPLEETAAVRATELARTVNDALRGRRSAAV